MFYNDDIIKQVEMKSNIPSEIQEIMKYKKDFKSSFIQFLEFLHFRKIVMEVPEFNSNAEITHEYVEEMWKEYDNLFKTKHHKFSFLFCVIQYVLETKVTLD